ncbi:hypothetical protein ACFMQL_36635 [Nonomuraea fastidiosa]|uniref:hypothetical protein n=1 Tax=Nonomuraea fastidiosa TaxID=46173 RepID=UPI0036735836
MADVVRAAPAERDQERLPDEVLGEFGAEAEGDVPVQRPGVPVEQDGELLRIIQGIRDDLGVHHHR